MLEANVRMLATRPRLIESIRRAPSTYRIERTRTGEPAPVRISDGRWIASRYDPVKEAERWLASQEILDQDLPVFVGFHPWILRACPRTSVVVEKDLGLLRACLEAIDLSDVLGRATVIEDSDGFNLMAGARNAFDPFRHMRVRILVPPHVEDDAWVKAEAEGALRVQRELSLNALSLACQLPRWIATMRDNLAAYMDSPDGSVLANALRGETAVLVGAGPSLDRNIRDLEKVRGRALLIAVDTALRKLDAAGIVPDVAVAVDANEANARDVEGLSAGTLESILVADPIAAPEIIRAYRGPRVFLRTINYTYGPDGESIPMPAPLDRLLSDLAGRRELASWQSGGSVSTNAFCLCAGLGIRRVILVGQDLAFSNRRTHAGGVGYEDAWCAGLSRFVSKESVGQQVVKMEPVTVKAWDGGMLPTSPAMREYLNWFEMTIRYGFAREMEVIDATEGGARKEGMKRMRLADAVRALGSRSDPAGRLRALLTHAPRTGREGWRDRLMRFIEKAEAGKGDPGRFVEEFPLARWLTLTAYLGSKDFAEEQRKEILRAAHAAAADFLAAVWRPIL